MRMRNRSSASLQFVAIESMLHATGYMVTRYPLPRDMMLLLVTLCLATLLQPSLAAGGSFNYNDQSQWEGVCTTGGN